MMIDPEVRKELGLYFRARADERGWTQRHTAQVLDTTQSNISRLYNGKPRKSDLYEKMAQALDMDFQELLQRFEEAELEEESFPLSSLEEVSSPVDPEVRKIWGNYLREIAEEKQLSQRALAQSLGVSRNIVRRIYEGRAANPVRYEELAAALDVSLDHLRPDMISEPASFLSATLELPAIPNLQKRERPKALTLPQELFDAITDQAEDQDKKPREWILEALENALELPHPTQTPNASSSPLTSPTFLADVIGELVMLLEERHNALTQQITQLSERVEQALENPQEPMDEAPRPATASGFASYLRVGGETYGCSADGRFFRLNVRRLIWERCPSLDVP